MFLKHCFSEYVASNFQFIVAYSLMHKNRYKSIFKKFNEKFEKYILFYFTCILPDYMAHETIKEFWKIIYFENMRAGA